jgi:tetratricopeptide (TPR) repeat protein
LNDMSKMAVGAQVHLARFYASRRQADSVLAAYRRIGHEIPAGKGDILGAGLSLALTYRSLGALDSTIAIYDRLLAQFYPPVDSLGRVNTDIIAIPIDKIKIERALQNKQKMEAFTRDALDYYGRLEREFPDDSELVRQSRINTSRIYTMTEKWDDAITALKQITDSTGQVDIAAEVLIANIYNGPKKDIKRAIEQYRKIIDRHPDSSIVGTTMLQLGMALCDEKQYDEGRTVLADLKQKFSASPRLSAKAQFYYAQSFEVQDRWDRALSEYQWLTENYPYSEDAFWAARRIPEHYLKEKNDKLADTWFERAVDFYTRAATVKKGEPIEIVADSYLAEIYRLTKQWDKAMETLDKIYSLAPRSRLGAKALYNAAAVAYNELDDSTKAQAYMDRLTREFGTTDSTQIYEEDKKEIDLESLE